MENQPKEQWREELEKVLPKLSERSWERIADQIAAARKQGEEKESDRIYNLTMSCLPKDAENLSTLTDDQAGRLMRCFLKKNPWQ